MIDGEDLLGDGVNVAARLEGTAAAGGICISDQVFQQLDASKRSAFADGDDWDSHVRICIAREDSILEGAMEKLQRVLR